VRGSRNIWLSGEDVEFGKKAKVEEDVQIYINSWPRIPTVLL
jgi:hypothetical protein